MAGIYRFKAKTKTSNNTDENKPTLVMNSSEGEIYFCGKDKIDVVSEENDVYITASKEKVLLYGKDGVPIKCEVKKLTIQGKNAAFVGDPVQDPLSLGVLFFASVHVFSVLVPPTTVMYAASLLMIKGLYVKHEAELTEDGATKKVVLKGNKEVKFAVEGTGIKFKAGHDMKKHKPYKSSVEGNIDNCVSDMGTTFLQMARNSGPGAFNQMETLQLTPTPSEEVKNAVTSNGASTTVFFEGKRVALVNNNNMVHSDSPNTLLAIKKK